MEEEVEPDLPGPMPGPSEDGNDTGGRGRTQSRMVNGTSTCGRRRSRRQSKSVKLVALVNSNAEESTPASTAMDGPMAPPTGFVHAPNEDRCEWCKRAGRACPVKPGHACWYCNRGKAKCSLVSELRGRSRAWSRAWSPGHRRSASPESSKAPETTAPRVSKRRRAPSTTATPGPSTPATQKTPRASKKSESLSFFFLRSNSGFH